MGERVILRTWDNCLEERQRMYFFILESQEINVSIPITVWYEIEKGSFVGVPKHSDLEPPYLLAKGDGNPAAKCRLIAYRPRKTVHPLP